MRRFTWWPPIVLGLVTCLSVTTAAVWPDPGRVFLAAFNATLLGFMIGWRTEARRSSPGSCPLVRADDRPGPSPDTDAPP